MSDVVDNFWTYKELRSIISDLLFSPFDLSFDSARIRSNGTRDDEIVKRSAPPRRFKSVRSTGNALTKSLNSKQTIDNYKPQPSLVALQAFDLTSDGDVWVERYYFGKKNQRVSYYRSYRTGKCVLSEPPSGAHSIVFRRDLDTAPPAIQLFAVERLNYRALTDLAKQLSKARNTEARTH